ncbi:PAS domain S-box protein [Mucilaginibacter sp.]|uniref:PAS domain S-box protein n=1 Tax=Mucilaginibacter sp. TaxID=1882438 RepID=UPI002634EFA4|nr:PAS domain S-box protein [Mucilaginibacter sp.]
MNKNTILTYWDKDQVCRFVNNAVFNWFGTLPEQMINKINLRDFLGQVYEQNRPFIKAAFDGKTQVFNSMIPTPSGKVLNARITYVPDFDENDVKGIFVHVADVSHLDKPTFNDNLKKTLPHNQQSLEDIQQALSASVLTGFPGISNLAKKYYVSESKLKRDFKEKYGVTIFAYYRNLQMELANKYLSSKKYNKNQMALMFNFSNPSNFSLCYKKYLKHRQLSVEINNHNLAKYKDFVEQSAAAVAMFDINMHFITTSKKWLKEYNLSDTELAGKSLNAVLPNIEEKFRALQLDSLKGIVNNYTDLAVIQKEGTPGWIRLDIQPWYKNIDEVGGVLIFTKDITALKQMEEKDKQFFEILNKTNEIERIGTWYQNLITNTAAWSKITREILEVDDDYVISDLEASLKFYKEGKSRDLVKSSLNKVFKKRGSFDIEVELITAKKNLKRIRLICYSEFQNDKCEKISGVFHDIGSY